MAISQEWWDKWWEQDFSWEGLAKKRWEGWVVMDDGRVLPMEDAPGKLRKDRWGNLRLPKGFPGRQATLQDYWRDQKDHLIPSPDGSVRFTPMHLPPVWRDGTPVDPSLRPDEAQFNAVIKAKLGVAEETSFNFVSRIEGSDRRAQFQGVVFPRFRLADLTDRANDLPTTQDEPARIPLSARFQFAAFSGDAWFENAAFSGAASFENAAFSGYARFENAAFSGYASFENAAFSGAARFDNAAFSKDAWFNNAAFSGDARFDNAAFSKDAWFINAAFSGDARFDKAEISTGSYDDVKFGRDVHFTAEKLGQDVGFDGARFTGPHRIAKISFGIWFVLLFVFCSSFLWSNYADSWRFWVAAVLSIVSGLGFYGWSVLGGLVAASSINADLKSAQTGMRALRRVARQSLNHELEAIAHSAELKYRRLRPGATPLKALFTKPIDKVFSCCYEAFSDYGQSIFRPILWLLISILVFAGAFFLWTDRHTDCDMDYPPFTLWMAPSNDQQVDWFSPFQVQQAKTCSVSFYQALDFSWSNTFKPLSALMVGDDGRNELTSHLLYSVSGSETEPKYQVDQTGFWVRVVATGQSFLAIILAFLLALAIRRRFQIS